MVMTTTRSTHGRRAACAGCRAGRRRERSRQLRSRKPVRVEGISIFTCRQGKIVEQIITYDVLGMLQQMGATTIPT